MKIIHIIDSLATGGVNSFVYDLCKAQQKAGDDVSIIVILKKELFRDIMLIPEGIRAEYLNAESKRKAVVHDIPKLRRMIREITKGESAICNLHLKLSVLMGALAASGLKNIKCVETYHNSYRHYYAEFFFLQPFITKYITVSETARQEMNDRFHAPRKKVIAVPNGADRKGIRKFAKDRDEKHSGLKVISVGRIAYPKNFSVPVGALSAICSEQLRYYVIGDGEEREEAERARNQNPWIIMTGSLPREAVLEQLSTSDLLIMSSLWEGRSILQLEAMAFDLPMVISDVPGLREPFHEEELKGSERWRRCGFGYLVRANDAEAYLKAVQDYLANPGLGEEMRRVVRTVSEENDISVTAERYRAVYESIPG